MSQPIAIIGAGSWGTALAIHLARNNPSLLLWTRDADQAAQMNELRTNPDYLPGVTLPESIKTITDVQAINGAACVLVAVPSRAMAEVAQLLQSVSLPTGIPVITCTKGIEHTTGRRMSQILSEQLPDHPIAALSGPSHAEEVALDKPGAVVVAAQSPAHAKDLQARLAGGHLRIYTDHDVAGVELGGALKNIFAIAAGVGDGLGLGDNSKAALVTRALAEMIRLGIALGGERETFQGLSGVGDLMVTCFSRHSRNRRLGEMLGQGQSLAEAEATLKQVAEGVPTTRNVWQLAQHHDLRAPIVEVVHRMLFEGLPAGEALRSLIERDLRHEKE